MLDGRIEEQLCYSGPLTHRFLGQWFGGERPIADFPLDANIAVAAKSSQLIEERQPCPSLLAYGYEGIFHSQNVAEVACCTVRTAPRAEWAGDCPYQDLARHRAASRTAPQYNAHSDHLRPEPVAGAHQAYSAVRLPV